MVLALSSGSTRWPQRQVWDLLYRENGCSSSKLTSSWHIIPSKWNGLFSQNYYTRKEAYFFPKPQQISFGLLGSDWVRPSLRANPVDLGCASCFNSGGSVSCFKPIRAYSWNLGWGQSHASQISSQNVRSYCRRGNRCWVANNQCVLCHIFKRGCQIHTICTYTFVY